MAGASYHVDRGRELIGPTELRIHGVGAAPPERMLDTLDPVLVAGDDVAGFYRRPLTEDQSACGHDTHTLEAYSWGGLTARGTGVRGLKKALWVFLLPFALINTARWMIPERQDGCPRRLQQPEDEATAVVPLEPRAPTSRLTRPRKAVIDLLAYLATLGGFGMFYAITVDGIGLNCLVRSTPDPCAKRLGLGWLAEAEWLVLYPSRMVVLSLVPVVAVLLVFAYLARYGQGAFQRWAGVRTEEVAKDEIERRPLIGDPSLWLHTRRSKRLRWLHIAGTLALLTISLRGAALALDDEEFRADWWSDDASALEDPLALLAFLIIIACGIGCTLVGRRIRGHIDQATGDWMRWLPAVAAVLLGIAAFSTAVSASVWEEVEESLVFERFGLIRTYDADAEFDDFVDTTIRPELDAALSSLWDRLYQEDLDIEDREFAGLMTFLELDPTPSEIKASRAVLRELMEGQSLPADVELAARGGLGTQFLEEVAGRAGGWYFYEHDDSGIALAYSPIDGVSGSIAVLLLVLAGLMIPGPRNWSDGAFGLGPVMLVVVALVVGLLGLISVSRLMFVYLDVSLNTAWVESSLVVLAVIGAAIVGQFLVALILLGLLQTSRRRHLEEIESQYWDAVATAGHDVSGSDERRELSGNAWLSPLYFAIRTKPLATLATIPLLFATVVAIWIVADEDVVYTLFESPFLHSLALLVSIAYVPLLLVVVWKSTRVGHLWDVLTFWPREGHPFAPPGYAHRAVPEISARITHRLQQPEPRPVVLAGHSQGSVIAASVVAGLPQTHREHVALLTYGSPLTRLYCRFFPTYFGNGEMRRLAALLTADPTTLDMADPRTRWRNLYRRSDPIGAPIFAHPGDQQSLFRGLFQPEPDPSIVVDIASPDPSPVQPPLPGDPMPPVKGHSGYEEDQPYVDALHELMDILESDPQRG